MKSLIKKLILFKKQTLMYQEVYQSEAFEAGIGSNDISHLVLESSQKKKVYI